MEDITNQVFVVINRTKSVWGRSSTLRGAFRDAGWKGDLDAVPQEKGIEIWLNIQGEADMCTTATLNSGEFREWDHAGEDAGREEPIMPGRYAPPFVRDGNTIIHRGALLRIF